MEQYKEKPININDNEQVEVRQKLIEKLDLPYPQETVESYNGEYTQEEIDIAEAIFAWWISGKGYNQWYAENVQQQKLDFTNQNT